MATEDPALRARGANFRLFLPRKQSLRGHPALFDGEYPIPNGSSPQIHVDAAHILQGTAGFVHSNALLHRVSWFSTRLFRIRLGKVGVKRIHARKLLTSITTLTRHLVACSSALMTSRWQPHLFRDLRSMHISLAEDGSRIQGSILNRILSKPTLPVMASRLTSLKMTGLWRIDVDLLSTVAKTFPGLTDLHLSCSENLDTSCCWLCYEESSMAVIHSPIPDHYANVKTLTVSLSTSTSLDVVKPHRMRSRRPFGRLSDWFICISEYFFRTKTWWTRTANTTTVLRSTNAHSSHLQRRTSQISQ